MFRIKICGITSPADGQIVGASAADAIGLNFYPQSRRFITLERAEQILAALPPHVTRVGLFVNATDDEVCRVYDHLQLDMVQLHGDEPPEFLLSLGERPVLRAFRLGPQGMQPIVSYLDQCHALGALPEAVLIDAYHPGSYGGTGHTADWTTLVDQRNQLPQIPLVLAGGLNVENIAEAIAHVRPDAVDVCSGVEESPAVKDREQMMRFARIAADAFDELLK